MPRVSALPGELLRDSGRNRRAPRQASFCLIFTQGLTYFHHFQISFLNSMGRWLYWGAIWQEDQWFGKCGLDFFNQVVSNIEPRP